MTISPNESRIPQWTLGDRLRKAREWAGMNQTQLAEQLQMSRLTIGRMETGARAIKRPNLANRYL